MILSFVSQAGRAEGPPPGGVLAVEDTPAPRGPAPDDHRNGPACLQACHAPDMWEENGSGGLVLAQLVPAVSPWSQVLPLGPIQSHLGLGAAVTAQPGSVQGVGSRAESAPRPWELRRGRHRGGP